MSRLSNIISFRTKSKKLWAYIFEDGIEACKQWQKISKDFELTHTACSARLKRATMEAFPNDPEKHLAFNGLRHSYATCFFEIGLSMGYVAKCLGNTEKVCQKHYTGWERTPDSMALIHTLAQNKVSKDK